MKYISTLALVFFLAMAATAVAGTVLAGPDAGADTPERLP